MKRLGAFLATLLLAGNAFAAFPALTGRVVDNAHILSPQTQQSLTAMLAAHEQKTQQQVVVVTVPSLGGQPIEQYGYQLGRTWGIGQKGANNGALLIVAPKEHRVRIEVGYGLEGTLTDAICSQIIQTIVLPDFRAGNIEQGVVHGTTAILTVLNGGTVETPSANPVHLSQNSASFIFSLILFCFVFYRLAIIIVFLFGWVIAHLINFIGFPGPLNKLEKIEKTQLGHRYITGPGFYVGGGSSGGGFSGGFSGGGGGFGGGGASGGW